MTCICCHAHYFDTYAYFTQAMDSEEDSQRPTNRRRVEEDSDDDMIAAGHNRFGNGAEDDAEGSQQPLPPYELHRVQPDPFTEGPDMYVVTDLQSATQLMASFHILFELQHYQGEAYSGMIAKMFRLPVTESQPDQKDVLDAVLRRIHESSPVEVAEQVKMHGCHTDSMITGIRTLYFPNQNHPDVQDTYEEDMAMLDTMALTVHMHKLSLLSIIALQAGDLKLMSDATITMKPFEDLKEQVKLQKHLFRVFEDQENRVFAGKVSMHPVYSLPCTAMVFPLLLRHLAAGLISALSVQAQVMRQIVVPVVNSSGVKQYFKTRCWKVLYRDPMGGKQGSEVGTTELDVDTWVNDNLDTTNSAVLEWSASSSEKHSAREALRINHRVSIAAAQRHLFSFASGDMALVYDIRSDKSYPMGNGLPDHMMVGGYHPSPFDPYLDNREGGFWDGNWFDIPTALDKVIVHTLPSSCHAAFGDKTA